MLNTIEYNAKLHQIKMTMINCKGIWIKGLIISTSHRRYVGIPGMYMPQQ